MKLHKHLHEMTTDEAFPCLQAAAIAIIKGDDLPDEVRQWVGRGLLAMCNDHTMKLNEAFAVEKIKKPHPFKHASRYAQVEYFRQKMNMTKDNAIAELVKMQFVSIESIKSSWLVQNKKQQNFKKFMEK